MGTTHCTDCGEEKPTSPDVAHHCPAWNSPSGNHDDECPGAGKCHGPCGWCSTCGDVKHVCDMRLRFERCDAHPIPPHWASLRTSRMQAERTISAGKAMVTEGQRALEHVEEQERARRAFDAQEEERDAAFWKGLA